MFFQAEGILDGEETPGKVVTGLYIPDTAVAIMMVVNKQMVLCYE